LADKSYQKASNLRSVLKKYLTELKNFNGDTFNNVTVLGSEIRQKVLRIAIPPEIRYKPTKAQRAVLDEIISAGRRGGIQVVLVEVHG
jgi:hypothetical protein